MKLDTLQRLYLNQLHELFYAEHQILKALPKMANAASSQALRDGLETHIVQTRGHIERLQHIFEERGEKPRATTRQGIKGLIEDALDLLQHEADPSVLDAGIAVAAQKIEHYEIAIYSSLVAFADMLGYDKSVGVLQATLDEEAEVNELLESLIQEVVTPEVLMETELGRSWSRSLSELLS